MTPQSDDDFLFDAAFDSATTQLAEYERQPEPTTFAEWWRWSHYDWWETSRHPRRQRREAGRLREIASMAHAAGYRAALRTLREASDLTLEPRIYVGGTGYLFPQPLYDELLAVVRTTHDEVCGLLGGRDGAIERVFPIRNAANEEPADSNLFHSKPTTSIHYVMDPLDQLRAYNEMEAGGLTTMAYFHSHPGGDAMPSGIDVRLAREPDALWILVSERADPPIRAWRIEKPDPRATTGQLIEVPLA